MSCRVRFVALAAFGVSFLSAQNPLDVDFNLRLLKDSRQYAVDEPIEFEISLASSAHGKYEATLPDYRCVGASLQLVPANDASLVREAGCLITGYAPSRRPLTATPASETADLTEWYRFEKPGHYRLSIALNIDQGKQVVPVTSNSVEFEVLAPDPAWQATELQATLDEIDHASDEAVRAAAIHRLDLLQTHAATLEKLKRYFTERSGFGQYSRMLRHSSHLDLLLPPLEEALVDPSRVLPADIVDLLATLRVRAGPQTLTEATAIYNQKLLETVRARSGPARAQALYIAWLTADIQYARTVPKPEVLLSLFGEVLPLLNEIPADERGLFLYSAWSEMSHAQVLPVIRELAQSKSAASSERSFAYKLWCEEDREGCGDAILQEAQHSDFALRAQTILPISPGAHPELDSVFIRELENNHVTEPTGALILRAASAQVRQPVEAYLDRNANDPPSCEARSYLIGYLFRISAENSVKRLTGVLHEPLCGLSVLHFFHYADVAPESALPAIIAELYAQHPMKAERAALFLSAHGDASAKLALTDRLNSLRYHSRTDDSARFEMILVAALANGKAWALTDDEKHRMLAGCRSESCRKAANEKFWLRF